MSCGSQKPAADLDITGGQVSRSAIAEICGVSAGPWHLEAVASGQGGRVTLALTRGEETATVFLQKSPTENYFIRSGSIDISYEGSRAGPHLTKLLASLGQRLENARPETLLAILQSDPDAKSNAPKTSEGQADPDSKGISDRLGGNPGQWRRFFCDREFKRHSFWQGSSGFKGKVLYFVHADYDCSFMPPDITYRGMTFLNYPPVHPHSGDAPLMDTHYEHWTSELKDNDVVGGTDHKIRDLMDEIRSRVKPDLIMIQWSCVPTVIGDDNDRLAQMCKEAGRCPVLTNTIQKRLEEGGDYSPFEELFTQLKTDPAFVDAKRDLDAVNLVDVPPYYFDDELSGLLNTLGIRTNFRIFPTVDLTTVKDYLKTRCQILPEYFREVPTVSRSLGSLGLETRYAPPPFGIRGAREYVRAVTAPFKKQDKAMELFEARWSLLRDKFERLRRQAEGHQVTFVADAADIPLLLRREFLTGLPVVEMIGEMGFGVEFIIYSPTGDEDALRKLTWFAKPPIVKTFQDKQGLEKALADSKSRAVYSDIFFDKRITRAGKAQFSMRTFEAGLEGMVRSLERMLGVCRLSFYDRYKKHIARAHA